MVARQKSLFDVTLAGPGLGAPETLRVSNSEVIALEKKGFTVTEQIRAEGLSAFAEATQALSRLHRHAELTGNGELLAKAADAIQALLRGNRLMSGGTAHAERERTMRGVAPPGRGKR
jgi:hypothetical protein